MNTADSEEMAQPLKSRGFMATEDLQQADIVLMNTCTVREQAEHRADSNIGRLRKWKDADPHRILIVAGCAASRWGDSIQQKYPFIDLVSPATRIEQFPEAVAQVLKERWDWDKETILASSPHVVSGDPPIMDPRQVHSGVTDKNSGDLFGDSQTAYVTIMRGCNYSCSYCIVPQVRGREIYRPMDQILEEIRGKVRQGYKEVMLLGQTVNSYYWRTPHPTLSLKGEGQALPSPFRETGRTIIPIARPVPVRYGKVTEGRMRALDFSDLLRAVNAIEGLERIRFMSPHPRHMRDPVIQAMTDSEKVCRHIHLPAQSGSSRLLERMKRLYTRDEYVAIVAKLRAAMPGILITTDIIVGFPGETETDFHQTLSLLEDVQFNGLFAFKYSPRPGTASAELLDDVPDPEKENRLQKVLALNEEIKMPTPAAIP
jgi:tRNA-2-methylthio-N6-dimethylallyladenosine synthase